MQFTRLTFALICLASMAQAAQVVDYDIVYVRQPRAGDNEHVMWPEVFHPARIEPGCDLMLLHPDGSEEVLVDAGEGAATDPFVSFDAKWVYYAFFHQVDPVGAYNITKAGSDIFKINLETREIVQLTDQEFTPNMGSGTWLLDSFVDNPTWVANSLVHGIINLGPCPLPGGKIAFVSSRNGFTPPKLYYTAPTLQLFVMDDDGSNVQCIAPMSIGSAMHPVPLKDGRIMFSSYESQGLRDLRMWGLWAIWPDGRKWEPLMSAFLPGQALHFTTQLSNEDIVVENYYNLNNFGFGTLYSIPPRPPQDEPPFQTWVRKENTWLVQVLASGIEWGQQMSFTPKGITVLTPFSSGADEAAAVGSGGTRVGKFTHPCAAPNNDLLVAYSAGPVNALNRPVSLPAPDAGIYLIRDGGVITSPNQLVKIKNNGNYNEVWPRPVVPYIDVHGVEEPVDLPWLPNDGSLHPDLPEGTPYGLVGSSSLIKRDTFPGYVIAWENEFDGMDAFNTTENDQSTNWIYQGADAGLYKDKDIYAVRLLAMEPVTDRYRGPNSGRHYESHAGERLRILGEIPVLKFNPDGSPIKDPDGNPDTSFLAKIPADTPFTFQTLDKNGMVLNMAQTWHQVRPGEVRNDCGGCHAHSQMPLAFDLTAAGQPGYQVWDLSKQTPLLAQDDVGETVLAYDEKSVVDVEFIRDIRPILKKHCTPCHTKKDPTPPGNLVLDDRKLEGTLPNDYERLAWDRDARWGYKPLVTVGGDPEWRQTNASRYIRMFQSRRSLLVWKIFGERLDGWKNKDHPTEKIPGDRNSLKYGVDPNDCDLDYTGTIMPPPDSGVPPLSEEQKMLIVRWIDLGCPIDLTKGTDNKGFGWYLDDLRPTLTVSSPRPGANPGGPLSVIRIGVADANSGIKNGSLSVKCDAQIVAARNPGDELADYFQLVGDGIYQYTLPEPIPVGTETVLHVQVSDKQGNVTWADVEFSVTE
ncbi:MAG: hypothetical protein HUU46_10870 [Candidatus Hydrogenedentes bacterium]|nr:hypothetical protein [Candidatus Hydrogenedentota bacterium]